MKNEWRECKINKKDFRIGLDAEGNLIVGDVVLIKNIFRILSDDENELIVEVPEPWECPCITPEVTLPSANECPLMEKGSSEAPACYAACGNGPKIIPPRCNAFIALEDEPRILGKRAPYPLECISCQYWQEVLYRPKIEWRTAHPISEIQFYVNKSPNCHGLGRTTLGRLGPEWIGSEVVLPFGPEGRPHTIIGWTSLFGGGPCSVRVFRAVTPEGEEGFAILGGNAGVRILDDEAEVLPGVNDHLPRGWGQPFIWVAYREDLPERVLAVVDHNKG